MSVKEQDRCALCGREKLKARVQRPPPMTESADVYCLHPSNIYALEMPPCEQLGIERIAKLTEALESIAVRNGECTYCGEIAGRTHRADCKIDRALTSQRL